MREYLRAALLPAQLGIAFLSIASGVTVLQLRPWLIGTAKKAEATVDYAGQAAHHIDKVAGISEDAANRERDFFKYEIPKLASESDGLLVDGRAVLNSLARTSDGLNDSQHRIADATVGAINGLQPTEKEIADTIPYIRKSVTDIDALALNQDIPKTLHNVQETTSNVDGTTKDVQQAVHAYLHPTLPKRIWGWVEGTGLDVAKIFIP